jgi:hypothetical protein
MPVKRSRSPASDAATHRGNGRDEARTIADLFPYQEIFLRVLSFLSPTELVHVQGVSKYWAKMSLDPQVSDCPAFLAPHKVSFAYT